MASVSKDKAKKKKKKKNSQKSTKSPSLSVSLPGQSDGQNLPPTSSLQPYIVYNISQCEGFQIGDRTNLVFEAGQRLKSRSDSQVDVVIGMLNSILNPTCTEQPGEMNLQRLEAAFARLYGTVIEGKNQTFKMIMEQSMKMFIQQHLYYFDLENRSGNWCVKQRRHVDETSTATQSVEGTSIGDPHSNTLVAKQISREIAYPEPPVVDDLQSTPWVKVTRNKETVQSLTVEKNKATIKRLLQTPTGPGLIVLPSVAMYLEDRALFSLDIVSMWNTPEISGHILLGAQASTPPPHEVTGLSQSRTDQQMQEFFLTDSFSTRPVFNYDEVELEEKRVGLITVNSSAGQGKPCTTERSQSCFENGQLWYRKGEENILCNVTDNSVATIYNWFIGSKHNVTELNIEQDEPFNTQITDSTVTNTEAHEENFLDVFSKGHCILVVGQIPRNTRNLTALMKIPWLYVFDFDIDSRSTGTLGACQSVLERKRSVYIRNWGMPPVGVSDSATTWCFVRGTADDPEFRDDGNSKTWRQNTRKAIQGHCRQLMNFAADYTTLRVLVVWPSLDFCPHHLYSFLQDLDDTLEPRIEMSLSSMPTSDEGKSVVQSIKTHLKIQPKQSSVEKLCHDINVRFEDYQNGDGLQMKLPIFDGEISQTEICDRDKLWFREDLDVLYLDSPYSRTRDTDAISDDIDEFFKGGTIHWYTWYECSSGFIDIKRDLMDKILPELEDRCRTPSKPSLITLLHAPGSGGTTLAQRLLWELHTKTPCVQVRTGTDVKLEQVTSKIEHLYKVTGSIVVVLVDGEEETRVKLMASQLCRIPTIILYAKRCTYRKESDTRNKGAATKFYLQGEVSSDEAKRLCLKLKDRIEDKQRQEALDKLTKNVCKGTHHCLYEFGLAAYLHEFRGITSYVRGYMNLEGNPSRDLLPWQKLLGYLSLVYYYGQACVPCQFFANLIGKPPNYDVSLEDFPQSAREFIKESQTTPKCIRISHYVIAREILEQTLTRHQSSGYERDNPDPTSLSKLAKQNLKDFAVDFINYSSQRKTKDSTVSETIIYTLTKTFIMREYRDAADIPGEGSVVKPKVSKLLSDLELHPPFGDQLKILQTLCSSYPMNPNFHAHLGRFYTYCPTVDIAEAEQCFEKALTICDDLDKDDIKVKQTLTHVYHMYGMVYLKKVKAAAQDKSLSKNPEQRNRIMETLNQTERACDLFQQCREYLLAGQEHSHGYISEIEVRLCMCNAIEKTFGNIAAFMRHSDSHPRLVQFLTTSLSEVDNLVMQCWNNVDPDELGAFFYDMIFLFNITFQKNVAEFEKLYTRQNSHTRRLKIATTKMKAIENPRKLADLNHLSKKSITKIVELYEANFTEVKESGDIGNRKSLETDYREWIVAIRQSKLQRTYELEDVYSEVQTWYDNLRTPLSLFYVFVLRSVMGFEASCESTMGFYLSKANDVKEELMKKSGCIRDARYPREWLGRDPGIRRLVHCSRSLQGHLDRYSHKRNIKLIEPLLAVCKGTISFPNKNLSGFIVMDLENTAVTVPIKVFFVPKRGNLEGERYVGQRVAFHLAFTMDKGYEAFGVRLLETIPCPECQTPLEMKSGEAQVTCSECQETVFNKD